MFTLRPAEEVITAYLQEVPRVVAGSDAFAVFTHIDYAVRTWPSQDLGPFDPRRLEEAFRTAVRTKAAAAGAPARFSVAHERYLLVGCR